jgi:hypothetical protein
MLPWIPLIRGPARDIRMALAEPSEPPDYNLRTSWENTITISKFWISWRPPLFVSPQSFLDPHLRCWSFFEGTFSITALLTYSSTHRPFHFLATRNSSRTKTSFLVEWTRLRVPRHSLPPVSLSCSTHHWYTQVLHCLYRSSNSNEAKRLTYFCIARSSETSFAPSTQL